MYETGLTFVSPKGLRQEGGGFNQGATAHRKTMTATSVRASPPQLRGNSGGLVAGAVIFALFGIAYHWLFIVALLFAVAAFNARSKSRAEYDELYAQWDAQYMCDRCGAIGEPVAIVPPAAVITYDSAELPTPPKRVVKRRIMARAALPKPAEPAEPTEPPQP